MTPGDLIPLALYLVQQLGIMLGVGSATVLLILYLVSMRDGLIENKEAQFSRLVQHVLEIGLVCIVLSGALITTIHGFAGESEIISSPAYFFKWLLVAFVSVALILRRARPFVSSLWEGLVGATWYALFILHVVAPIAHWGDLLLLYAVWIMGFMLLWVALTRMLTGYKPAEMPRPAFAGVQAAPAPQPKPVAPPTPKVQPVPVQPKPVPPPVVAKPVMPVVVQAAPPVVVPKAEPAPIKLSVPSKPPPPPAGVAPVKPADLIAAQNISLPVPVPSKVPEKPALIKNTDDTDLIPHIYIMPRTPEDVERHMKSAELQFT